MNKDGGKYVDTVIIGGSQSGLAAGYCLQQEGIDFVILDGEACVGDAWRKRWDSLELFTPAQYNNLPGMPFPAPEGHLPTKDEMADYLQAYAQRFNLPVRVNTRVQTLAREGRIYHLQTNQGAYRASHVIVATGAYQAQRVPPFAENIDPGIHQMPSSRYRNPSQLPEGGVLIVGAGNSGAQIAIDIAQSGRKVWLSGRDTGHMKRTILGKDIFWWLWHTIFRVRAGTWLGRRLRQKLVGQGAALVDISEEDLAEAGIARVPRTTDAHNGKPQTDGGEIHDVSTIIWATGFEPNFKWIRLPIFEPDGFPRHRRGVVHGEPGLYFLGLPFLYRGNSSLVGGVGRDAAYAAKKIALQTKKMPATTAPETQDDEPALVAHS
jgi:putative flavoprotein involved in K+ transport